MSTPNLTLYFLQASRSIRIAWLLEELSLPYESIFFPRIQNKAPSDFTSKSGNPLGKAPAPKDGSFTLTESGAITEYLLQKYDKTGRLAGGEDEATREKWGLKELERGLAVNVGKDLDWLERELEGKVFLVGDNVTAADTMVLFSVQFIFARDLCAGRGIGEWRNVERWVGECEMSEGWKKAVGKTGHEM